MFLLYVWYSIPQQRTTYLQYASRSLVYAFHRTALVPRDSDRGNRCSIVAYAPREHKTFNFGGEPNWDINIISGAVWIRKHMHVYQVCQGRRAITYGGKVFQQRFTTASRIYAVSNIWLRYGRLKASANGGCSVKYDLYSSRTARWSQGLVLIICLI